ncbi:MAG TPA: HD domain-containing protein [Dissulfurispiraceae bacterium]|nr:HD domain-containing protein [Dissulfurispiraceae bacterium]
MDVRAILALFCSPESIAFEYIWQHGSAVAQKALQVASRMGIAAIDNDFLYEAAILHDLGILKTNASRFGCFGEHPYISHGYLGRDMLDTVGYPLHALICERHVGTGLTLDDIRAFSLPLPHRDMRPVTLEEQIICFADKFFSKDDVTLATEKPLAIVRQNIAKYGEDKLATFDKWCILFREGQAENP